MKEREIIFIGNYFFFHTFLPLQIRIDGLAGPSECLVVADDTSNASFIAADLLAQAEHDVDASAVLVSDSGAVTSICV